MEEVIDDENINKACRVCGVQLTSENSYPSHRASANWICKSCNSKKNHRYWLENPEYRTFSFEATRKWRIDNPIRQWATASLLNHKLLGHKIEISADELEILARTTLNCPICGILIEWTTGNGRNWNGPSLDRRDNSEVLEKNNVWLICMKCNTTKSSRTMGEFVEYCEKVVSNKERLLNDQ
jgi:5-methylcytosine-specific restriction endonuclease McrA